MAIDYDDVLKAAMRKFRGSNRSLTPDDFGRFLRSQGLRNRTAQTESTWRCQQRDRLNKYALRRKADFQIVILEYGGTWQACTLIEAHCFENHDAQMASRGSIRLRRAESLVTGIDFQKFGKAGKTLQRYAAELLKLDTARQSVNVGALSKATPLRVEYTEAIKAA
jgi:hypothetical protein